MLVLRTSNFQGATIGPIVPRHKHSIVFIVHHEIFFRTLVQKSIGLQLNCFPDFETKAVKAKYKIWKRKRAKLLNTNKTILIQFQLFIFYEPRLFTEKFSRKTTIHPGIFGGRALWADGGPPRMNTIASRDQFKPIRIGENLLVNYNDRLCPREIVPRDQFWPMTTKENLVVNYNCNKKFLRNTI